METRTLNYFHKKKERKNNRCLTESENLVREAAIGGVLKKAVLKISQYSQENTSVVVSFLIES